MSKYGLLIGQSYYVPCSSTVVKIEKIVSIFDEYIYLTY